MSKELIARLRNYSNSAQDEDAAADAIEALEAEVEAAKKSEIERLLRIETKVDELVTERDALQAQLAAAQGQEPVAKFNWNKGKFEWLTPYKYELHHNKPLYLAGGAAPIPQQVAEASHGIAHSLGGFRGGFVSEHGRNPTEQEIWNHAIRSYKDLQQAQPERTPTVSVQWLAEMIMSDCGCSTNNQSLLDRIINRIDQHERANTTQQAQPEPTLQWCDKCGEGTVQGLCRGKLDDCKFKQAQPERAPMTSTEIEHMALHDEFLLVCDGIEELTEIVRAVELHHNIKQGGQHD